MKSAKRQEADRLAAMHAAGFREGAALTKLEIAGWLRSLGAHLLSRVLRKGFEGMATKQTVVCDGCQEEIGPGVACLGIYAEVEEAQPTTAARAKVRRKVRRPAYAQIELCIACSKKPIAFGTLFEANLVPGDDGGEG